MAKSRILFVLLCLLTATVLGQSYEKFVDTTKVWHVFYECSGPCPPMWDHYRRYYFEGDTLIDSISYRIYVGEVLIKDYNTASFPITVDSAYQACFIREDTVLQKVFIYYDERYWSGRSIYEYSRFGGLWRHYFRPHCS